MVDRLLVVLVLPLILLLKLMLSLVLLMVVLVAVLEVLSSGAARIGVASIAATAKGLMMGAMFRFGRRSILDRFVRLQFLLQLNPSLS